MAQVHHSFEQRNHRLRSSVAGNIRKTRKRLTTAAAISAVRAELIGSNCATALGVEARGPSPVLALCRALVEAGLDLTMPLLAYRGDVLALRVRSIGEDARLEVNSEGTGFRPATKPGQASLVRQNEDADAHDIAIDNDGRPLTALYVGDWDPSGLCMSERDLPARLASNNSGSG